MRHILLYAISAYHLLVCDRALTGPPLQILCSKEGISQTSTAPEGNQFTDLNLKVCFIVTVFCVMHSEH